MINPENPYTQMQKQWYKPHIKPWDGSGPDPGFERFASQNAWPEYEYLFNGFDFPLDDLVALDFGCGPGRNLVHYGDRFKRIDGVDMSSILIDNAKLWASKHGFSPNLFVCNGVDLSCIDSEQYDIVMSTICLQHIPVIDIRRNYFSEFCRVLKPGGWVTIQMGFDDRPRRPSIPGGWQNPVGEWGDNDWTAAGTNGCRDVEVESEDQPKSLLEEVGFTNFSADVRPGGNIGHAKAIFFRAQKPL